jgi:hypothetical protein
LNLSLLDVKEKQREMTDVYYVYIDKCVIRSYSE